MISKIGIIGLGFVGGAIFKSFIEKGYKLNENLFVYDKYKDNGIGSIDEILYADITFVSLPTIYNTKVKNYELNAINETLELLKNKNYKGLIVLKSTIEPGTSDKLSKEFGLDIVHNPEFLTARTAFYDFHNQTHIVLGKCESCDDIKYELLYNFYNNNYKTATISKCQSIESESMKLFLNSFYAVKVQFFTEIYLLCQKLNLNYDNIKDLMLKNGWINSMHTTIPGPDGKISYGGLCFPKDTLALSHFMEKLDIPYEVLKATISERSMMRTNENENIS